MFRAVFSHSLLHISSLLFNIKREEEGCWTPAGAAVCVVWLAETIFSKNEVRGLWRDFPVACFGNGFRPPATSFGKGSVLGARKVQMLWKVLLAITTLRGS
jgi:hypothetical protein